MKRLKFYLIVALTPMLTSSSLMFLLVSCSEESRAKYNQEYVIDHKETAIESRLQPSFDYESIERQAVTVYYFYEANGMSVEVQRQEYHKYKVGDTYKGYWK